MKKILSVKLRQLRGEESQASFAEKIGVKQVTYSTWERGSSEPSASAIAAIALACGVSTDWLLGVDSCSPPDKRIADLKQAIITLLKEY